MYQFFNDFFSLNPTFSGMWSATTGTDKREVSTDVLILLFLECGLRHLQNSFLLPKSVSLNPTFSGMWSATLVASFHSS